MARTFSYAFISLNQDPHPAGPDARSTTNDVEVAVTHGFGNDTGTLTLNGELEKMICTKAK